MAFACPQFSTRLLEALRQSRHIAVFTGAGISAESGVTTFRTAQTGLWHHLDPQQVCSITRTSLHEVKSVVIASEPVKFSSLEKTYVAQNDAERRRTKKR